MRASPGPRLNTEVQWRVGRVALRRLGRQSLAAGVARREVRGTVVTTRVVRETEGRFWSAGALGGGGGRLERRGWVGVRRDFLGRERAHKERVARAVQQQVLVTLGDGLVGRPCLVEREQRDSGFIPCVAVEGEGSGHSSLPRLHWCPWAPSDRQRL